MTTLKVQLSARIRFLWPTMLELLTIDIFSGSVLGIVDGCARPRAGLDHFVKIVIFGRKFNILELLNCRNAVTGVPRVRGPI